MKHNAHSNNNLLWMLLGCGLFIVLFAVFGDRLSHWWLFALILGACVISHLFMMRGNHHDRHNEAKPDTEDRNKHNKSSCCH